MMIKHPDCSCEDYPCCGHYDSIEPDGMHNYCDFCGFSHRGDCPDHDLYEDDDEDAIAVSGVGPFDG